jgi:hypothetical protein
LDEALAKANEAQRQQDLIKKEKEVLDSKLRSTSELQRKQEAELES